jgi:hypothetical protein
MMVPMMAAIAIITSSVIAKRIEDSSSTASARPRRLVFSSIPVVLIDSPKPYMRHANAASIQQKGQLACAAALSLS